MSERRIEHVYNCSADYFWQNVFIDPEYNRRVYLEALQFSFWRLVSEETRGDEVHRVIEACPPMPDLPAALKKVVSAGLDYTERGIYRPKEQRYTLTVVPKALASKVSIRGELSTQAIDEKSCRRIYVGQVEAKVFGIGRMIEERILDDVEKSYAKVAEFTNRFLAERGV